MTEARRDHAPADAPDATATENARRIEGAVDEVFSRARDAVQDVADRATHLAQAALERGEAGIRKVERSSRGERPGRGGRGGTFPLATALAVGAMGYAIATLIQGGLRRRRATPVVAMPDKVFPATPAE
jgi:hypothetical protein